MENNKDLTITTEAKSFYSKRIRINILLSIFFFLFSFIAMFLFPKDNTVIFVGMIFISPCIVYVLSKNFNEKNDWIRYTTAQDASGIWQGVMDLRKTFEQALEAYPKMRKTAFAKRKLK